jgi:RNA polymerase sigma factor (sigma-70 family)
MRRMDAPRTSPGRDPERVARETRWLAQVAAAGAPRDAAMRALFDTYQGPFIKHLRWRGLSIEMALDTAQNVWIDVIRKAHTFRAGATPSSWLRGFLDIALADALRKQSRMPHTVSDADDGFTAVVDEALSSLQSRSPETEHALVALRRCVQGAIAAFKRHCADEAGAVYLRHVEEWTLEQMAEYRRSSVHATSEYLSKARQRFRPYIQPCLDLQPDR